MSADAKVWPVSESGYLWQGSHDGPCLTTHHEGCLEDVLTELEICLAVVRWEMRQYDNGPGLAGYTW